MAAVSGFAGIVSRSWRLPDGCNVEIQHNTILGGFDVFVDGEKVPGGNGTLSIFGSSAEIVVQSTACKATVHIEREGGRVRYACRTGGKEVQELSEALHHHLLLDCLHHHLDSWRLQWLSIISLTQ